MVLADGYAFFFGGVEALLILLVYVLYLCFLGYRQSGGLAFAVCVG